MPRPFMPLILVSAAGKINHELNEWMRMGCRLGLTWPEIDRGLPRSRAKLTAGQARIARMESGRVNGGGAESEDGWRGQHGGQVRLIGAWKTFGAPE